MTTRVGDPEPLDRRHTLDRFDCGIDSLNLWLTEHAVKPSPPARRACSSSSTPHTSAYAATSPSTTTPAASTSAGDSSHPAPTPLNLQMLFKDIRESLE